MASDYAIAVGDEVWVRSQRQVDVGTVEKIGSKLVHIRVRRQVQKYRRDGQRLNGCAYAGYCFETFAQRDEQDRRDKATNALRDRFAIDIGWRLYRDYDVVQLEGLLEWLEDNGPKEA